MNINWFPGHMAKTRRILKEDLKLVDVVIELLDARIPFSSQNPEISELTSGKKTLVVLNKIDLADMKANNLWQKYFKDQDTECIFVDTLKGKGINNVKETLKIMMKDTIEYAKTKGLLVRPIKTMVVGIPNVGKSSFINKIAGRGITVTGDKPGVTRNKQWVRINNEIELLDTPGVLWPKFEDINVGINLATTGAIKDSVFDIVEVTAALIEKLRHKYYLNLMDRYKLNELSGNSYDILSKIGKKRGCIISGGEIDLYRTSSIVLDELRSGKIGNISLEWPDKEADSYE